MQIWMKPNKIIIIIIYMNTYALIPLRGGSKGIPRKNIKMLNNRPLCDWTIRSCIASKAFTQIWVSTDDDEIKNVSEESGAMVHIRDPSAATDTATTSSVIHDFINNNNNITDDDIIVLIQATSPLTLPNDFFNAIKQFKNSPCEMLMCCISCHSFVWKEIDGYLKPINMAKSRRRQDYGQQYEEDGSFYIFTTRTFKKYNNIPFKSNKIIPYINPQSFHIEIDEPKDFQLMELLVKNNFGYNPKSNMLNKQIIVFDIGGTRIRSAIWDNKLVNFKCHNNDNNIMDIILHECSEKMSDNIVGIGISIGGVVQDGKVVYTNDYIGEWSNLDIKKELKEIYPNVQIMVENDGNCAAHAERFMGNAMDDEDFICLVLGTGVGVGCYKNGKIIKNMEVGWFIEQHFSGKLFENNDDYFKGTYELGKYIAQMITILNIKKVIINGPLIDLYNGFKIELLYAVDKLLPPAFDYNIIFSELDEQGLVGAISLFYM